MKNLKRNIEIVKEIDFERCENLYELIQESLEDVNRMYDELYWEMSRIDMIRRTDFNKIAIDLENAYEETLKSDRCNLELLEKELEEKMRKRFDSEEKIKEYLEEDCYRVDVKKMWEVEGKTFYSIMEHTPTGGFSVYHLFTQNGRLFNEDGEEIREEE